MNMVDPRDRLFVGENRKKMIAKDIREPLERLVCCCVTDDGNGLVDDGKPVENPTRVGISILFYGKRKSHFPYHCMVGPDWPFVALVYTLIVVINIVVLYIVHPIGWIPVMIGLIGAVSLLCAYSATVFSDPGIIYKNDNRAPSDPNDIESALSNQKSTLQTPIMTNTSTLMPTVPHTIECGQCELRRPYTARHCDYCKMCVDNLDHHCPWSGKCIAEKNIKAFYTFTSLLCFQTYYLMAVFIYFIIYLIAGTPVGPQF